MLYLIGIDAGGSSTKAVAYTIEGAEIERFQERSANPAASGLESAYLAIRDLIEACRKRLGDGIAHVLVGMAGIETGDLKARLSERLQQQYPWPIRLISDALLVLEARLGLNDGIVIISGTGSIAWGRHGPQIHRVGGWGHLIGDSGSGYAIAMEAIRDMARQRDLNRPFDRLGQAILDHLGLSDWSGLVYFVYHSDKAAIASLLPLIEEQMLRGNEQAGRLFLQAAVQLADMVVSCAAVLKLQAPAIAVSGSVLQRIPYLQKSLISELESRLPGCTIDFQSVDASRAVVFSYQKMRA